MFRGFWSQPAARLVFTERQRTLVAALGPVAYSREIGSGFYVMQIRIAVIDVGYFVWPHDAALLVYPDRRGNVDHVIDHGDLLLVVNQCREFGVCCFDPLTRVAGAARVLGHRYDLEVLGFELAVEFLPSWQVIPAPSP